MKIKKFYESEKSDLISVERVNEIISELSSISSEIDGNTRLINSLVNEMENYKTSSKSANNQIDDASIKVDIVRTKLDESTSLIDDIIVLLKNYTENGSKYLY